MSHNVSVSLSPIVDEIAKTVSEISQLKRQVTEIVEQGNQRTESLHDSAEDMFQKLTSSYRSLLSSLDRELTANERRTTIPLILTTVTIVEHLLEVEPDLGSFALQSLSAHGIQEIRIEPSQLFDFDTMESTLPQPTPEMAVHKVIKKGFTYHGRVIRRAVVETCDSADLYVATNGGE